MNIIHEDVFNEYVVAPSGDDGAIGTRDAPFRTIARAAALMNAGDVCLVRAGTYRELVAPANSGRQGRPIAFRNWPGERPRLVGFDIVSGWSRVEGDLWRAPLPWDLGRRNQIFVAGKPGQEARWPKKLTDDPLDWEGLEYDQGSCNEFLICSRLPDRPDDYWKGAILWVMAGDKWTSWSAVVTKYEAAEKKLFFDLPQQGCIPSNMSPSHPLGGCFYLIGGPKDLDMPGEWALDVATQTLYLRAPDGVDPNAIEIEVQRRTAAWDLSGRQHIEVTGFDVLGATLKLTDSAYCLVKDVRARWIGHTRGANTGYRLQSKLGVEIGGHHNTIRDSEIAYCAGNGLSLGGERHAVINCWIHHTDYSGSYDAPITLNGSEMLVSHNTIHDTGRDCIQVRGQSHIIEYNDIFNMGRLAHDLGATYAVASDGGNTEIRYNWCHDHQAGGTRLGIYLDNFSSNYLIHHNVIWNIRGCDIRLNKPSLRNVVADNTMLGNSTHWGRWATDWMYGCAYVNNAVCGAITPHPQAVSVSNAFNVPTEKLNSSNFQKYSDTGQAVVIPGISDGAFGIGAYAKGAKWSAGHDFASPPDVEYQPADTPLRNLVKHGSFDWERWDCELGPWRPSGAETAEVIKGEPAGILHSYTERDTIIGNGLCLSGEPTDGIFQEVEELRPNQRYELSAWVKVRDGAQIAVGIRNHGGDEIRADSEPRAGWQLLIAHFSTGAEAAKGTVFVTKTGPGVAFADHIDLVGKVKGIEPRLPGFAQP